MREPRVLLLREESNWLQAPPLSQFLLVQFYCYAQPQTILLPLSIQKPYFSLLCFYIAINRGKSAYCVTHGNFLCRKSLGNCWRSPANLKLQPLEITESMTSLLMKQVPVWYRNGYKLQKIRGGEERCEKSCKRPRLKNNVNMQCAKDIICEKA